MTSAATPPDPDGGDLSPRLLWLTLLGGSVLSLVVSYGIASRHVIVGSAAGRWVVPYVAPFTWPAVEAALCAGLVAGALLFLPVRRREWLVVAAWMVAAIAIQGLLRSLTPFSFERIVISDDANAFFGVTQRYYASQVLSDFARLRAYWPVHAQANMPGRLMLFYALELISGRPAVLAWLVVAISNLGGVFVYLFVRDLFEDRLAARFALVLYLFVPAKLYFFPLLSTVTPTVVFACAYLLLRWIRTSGPVYAALLGVAVYGLAFFDPQGLAIGLLMAALLGRALWLGDFTPRSLLRQGGLAVIVFATTHLAMRVWWDFDLFSALRLVRADAAAFNGPAGRPYSIWIGQNVLDFLFGVGICQAVIFGVVLGRSFRGVTAWPRRLAQPIAVVSLALAGTLLVIDFVGVSRGEVVRLWTFLACATQIPVAYACARLQSRAALVLVLTTTLVQDALGTAMIGFIIP